MNYGPPPNIYTYAATNLSTLCRGLILSCREKNQIFHSDIDEVQWLCTKLKVKLIFR